MNEPQPFLRAKGKDKKPSAGIFLSGQGSNAENILQQYQQMETPPLEITVLVTDRPAGSRAQELGHEYGIPVVENDILAFYRRHGEQKVTLKTDKGRELREKWSNELRGQLEGYKLEFGILAGFRPLTNIVGDFPCLNVHPGDLTYLKENRRHLVGLHCVPVERAILEGLDHLRSSVILATAYQGNGTSDMDAGPVLGVSEPVQIDLQGHSLASLRTCADNRAAENSKPEDRLRLVAEHNLKQLKERGDWVVFPPAVFDFARGKFAVDNRQNLYYHVAHKWQPVRTVVYGQRQKEIIFGNLPPGPQHAQ